MYLQCVYSANAMQVQSLLRQVGGLCGWLCAATSHADVVNISSQHGIMGRHNITYTGSLAVRYLYRNYARRRAVARRFAAAKILRMNIDR